jgi:magnesium-transporting ATPase (P-type)
MRPSDGESLDSARFYNAACALEESSTEQAHELAESTVFVNAWSEARLLGNHHALTKPLSDYLFCSLLIRYETTKAANAVAALKASLKPFATVKRDGKWQQIDARLVVPGDLVGLNAGAAVPADCRVSGTMLIYPSGDDT